ncbi:hypothetical protein PO883_31355 [Massilia sp. DJPM01]|uniref:hypothetical protein n=1 Tax=Massilia sp. DJPM01 TaxID=3024404 RepID=UPI00259D7C10|nr:hypothetical protein [Massilia sp. DJPM01]MDM5181678.1 hypothetical protein [Massilia sp. DJPM01]
MIDINKRITVIESLLAEGSIQSLTYAALECRLTIETICYERLMIAHKYIAASDLRKWKPAAVVKQVSEEANELIDKSFELFVSTTPSLEGAEPKTQEEYEALEYVKLGQQVGFKFSRMDTLWNGVASTALHVSVPKGEGQLSQYGDAEAIRKKVLEVLDELKKFQPNSLISSGLGMEYSFPCERCSTLIRRKVKLLQDNQVVGCFNPNCYESYTIHVEGAEITYSARESTVKCKTCSTEVPIPTRRAEKLRFGETLTVPCPSCKDTTNVSLKIMQEVRVTPPPVEPGA